MNIDENYQRPNEINSADESAYKKEKNKRQTHAIESCIRTDLMRLVPDADKAPEVENLFIHDQAAAAWISENLWQAILEGEKVEDWWVVSPSNLFQASSVIMQQAVYQAKGLLACQLGWLEKDIRKLISKLQRRLILGWRYLPETEKTSRQETLVYFIHELRAINAKQALRWSGDVLKLPVMKAAGKLASACQVELTRECQVELGSDRHSLRRLGGVGYRVRGVLACGNRAMVKMMQSTVTF